MGKGDDFRNLVEGIVLDYINHTQDPEVGMNGYRCTSYDKTLERLFEEDKLSAEDYVHGLSDGGLYEALSGMHCHQYR